ncbi:hypothetical protein A2W54_00350 [Candidatus Giovannonibacteria bacterium RIFCSPHIGHO2_02_43_13]|uniref:Uncharacterized protein n=1 Tax=Candidatus Giovannonibacteria bacterium RIFCSPHIGHO2_02_43_13 TaxID=1798330 RepID=A0A1F5WPR4_9BACT|nr:MAG: hypothetical protein A3E06_01055 [Candidatus Giovannonibacteria bacterium RIFCSPHIGHO2_12_FULL_44_42]OGF77648.1 MAG: hypothetical protein A2W54_00350 [Candidatus Giovannonibacteria bacterium RIFCSPHIGHO2_02_43_13]OGF89766.1 MAG: hypothetical protein A3I94_00010 [Candidatus Giovannonibacteria bacterium RIFCSPLOWO2_02_FULL_43_54]OGF96999.1 MAG: hypothetical protein A3H08_03685 [Candidatus Giovannonibacteria bacterium RIFCSPLOWO2_12_FULL_44_32]
MHWYDRVSLKQYLLICVLLMVIFASTLYFMGQVPVCKCGYVKLWHGVTYSSENSQHLSDWYTFSHIIHGFAFYGLARLLFRKWPVGAWLIFALILETGWEIFENTDFIINRYREVTISLDYYGDSVINSVFDVLFMVLGFFLARKLPIWAAVILIILMEVFVGWWIRDNLTLNIVMLLWPLDAIKTWQMGG